MLAPFSFAGEARVVNRVIVLGGYGGFGARLSRRLAADGWEVFVAGRTARTAVEFAARVINAKPLVLDRDADILPKLRETEPFALVDAAGPFQGSDYRVPLACIDAGIHYLDLADATDFVTGIGQLNEAALARGVAVISGASSIPALSGAVARKLAEGMQSVSTVEISISASNRATAGPSVAAAILGQVGKPVRLWRAGRWAIATGWQDLKRERYEPVGQPAMSRLVALADVPDHVTLPDLLPGKPATIFRAGPELGFQVLALWLLSWPVKWGLLASLRAWSRWLLPLQSLTAMFGSDRSAMKVALKGANTAGLLARSWTLIAGRGDGPEIPTMPAQLIARRLLDGTISPGARHAGTLLKLDDFRPLFEALAIDDAIAEHPYVAPYRRAMGDRFDRLPAPVRAMHEWVGDAAAAGRATVTRGSSPVARLIAAVMRFPPEGDHDIHVGFREEDGHETWTRDFSGWRFSSELREKSGRLVERFGPLQFLFELPSDENGLAMRIVGWSAFGIPMPLALAPRSLAREWAEGEDFCFDVPIALPLIGDVVHYTGRLRRL